MSGPEKTFERKVKRYLDTKGIWYLKTWSNGIQREGTPDILACVRGHFIGIELKADGGHPSDLQLRTIRQIRKAGGVAIVLYPEDFEDFMKYIERFFYLTFPRSVFERQYDFDQALTEKERKILYGTGQ